MARGKSIIPVILVVALIGLAGYVYTERKASESREAALLTEEHVVSRGDITVKVVADGAAVAKLTRVRSIVSGEVSRVHVVPGQQVVSGQLLLEINDKDYRAKLTEAEERLAAAVTKLENAKQEHETKLEDERTKVETEKSSLDAVALEYFAMVEVSQAFSEIYSKHEIELKRITHESAKQRYDAVVRAYQTLKDVPSYAGAEQLAVDQAEAAIASAQQEVEQTRVTAPVAGQIAQVLFTEGAYVGANADAVFIAAPGPLTAAGQVFELDIAGIDVGMPVQVSFEALQGQKFEGSVIAIDALPANGTDRMMMEKSMMPGGMSGGPVNYTTTVQLSEENPTIRSGMSCQIHFTKEHVEGVLIAPRSAVKRVEGKHFVQFKGADGSISDREVTIGRAGGNDLEIISGLEEGDKILIPAPLR